MFPGVNSHRGSQLLGAHIRDNVRGSLRPSAWQRVHHLPLATLEAGIGHHGRATETVSDTNLTIAEENWGQFDTGLGFEVRHTFLYGDATVTAEVRALWEHAFADTVPDQSLAFAGSPTSFTVRGPDAGENRARLGLGVSADITPMVSMDGRFKAVLSPEQQSYAASAHVRYTF